MGLLIFFVILAVVVSFLCSLLEAVLLSISYSYIAVREKKFPKSGLRLKKLKKNIDRPLAAILTLNTIANTVGATGVGAQVQIVFGYEHLAVASGLLTFTILVFSEIIPKTLGATHWKFLAPFCGVMIDWMIFLLYPFVRLSELLSRFLSRKNTMSVTREEMIMTAEMGVQEGAINAKESSIIKNLLLLNNIFVSDVMTPRSVLSAFDKTWTVNYVMQKFKPIRFSRIPVYSNDLDHIEGMVHRYKLMEASSNDLHDTPLTELMTPLHTIEEHIPVSVALDRFIKYKEHVFQVIDEYGTTTGIVTLEDAIETLLGVEIVDEFDSVADLRQYALEQWEQRKKQIRKVR